MKEALQFLLPPNSTKTSPSGHVINTGRTKSSEQGECVSNHKTLQKTRVNRAHALPWTQKETPGNVCAPPSGSEGDTWAHRVCTASQSEGATRGNLCSQPSVPLRSVYQVLLVDPSKLCGPWGHGQEGEKVKNENCQLDRSHS